MIEDTFAEKTCPRFEGVYCPSITITHDDGTIDYESWGRHLDHLIGAGINGVLLFGSIGEFYAFPTEIKEQVVDFVAKHVAGRIDVLVGVGGTNLAEVIEFSRYAGNAGASALVAISPYYFGPSDSAAERYFGAVASATSLPVILYNFPARSGNDLSPELVCRIVSANPTIVGIKDTVDTISHTRKVVAAVRQINPSFSVLSGYDEYYVSNRVFGGNGVLSGLTNVEPETFVAMHRAWESGDYAGAIRAAARISHLMKIYDCADLFISAIKGAVRVKGLPISTSVREPAVQLTDSQLGEIRTLLD